jgi:diguanylate cyclase (GGDEF)-like protein
MRIQGLTGICVVVTDLTDRKRSEALATLSLTDELTGLSNRRGFFTLAQSQLTLARRLHTEVALVFLDLDDFKTINDTFGHGNGDRALVDFAGLLKNTYRESDIIARLGGDEFAVLAAGTPEMSMLTLDDRLQKNLNAFNAAGHRPYQLRMSVGMVRCDYENPLPVPDLLALADAAMYEQKRGKHKHSGNLVA